MLKQTKSNSVILWDNNPPTPNPTHPPPQKYQGMFTHSQEARMFPGPFVSSAFCLLGFCIPKVFPVLLSLKFFCIQNLLYYI